MPRSQVDLKLPLHLQMAQVGGGEMTWRQAGARAQVTNSTFPHMALDKESEDITAPVPQLSHTKMQPAAYKNLYTCVCTPLVWQKSGEVSTNSHFPKHGVLAHFGVVMITQAACTPLRCHHRPNLSPQAQHAHGHRITTQLTFLRAGAKDMHLIPSVSRGSEVGAVTLHAKHMQIRREGGGHCSLSDGPSPRDVAPIDTPHHCTYLRDPRKPESPRTKELWWTKGHPNARGRLQ